jgi:diacylglycerol kinase family enzyme
MMRRRLLAVAALVLLGLGAVGAVVIAVDEFPAGLLIAALAAGLVATAAWGAVHTGGRRWAALALCAVLLVALVVSIATSDTPIPVVVVVAVLVLGVAAARAAFTVPADLPPAPRPHHAVVFWNPKAGGGKAERAHIDEEARKRGIEPVELHLGDDLRELVRAAVAGGADALAAAGGDGTQAIVATAAAEHGLPYACIPAGTRNHFALDLGVDRDDVVGALDALTDGRERRVDLAEVNGRVFVNNVSLGIYAEAVQRKGYREAKRRTIAEAVPETLGPDGTPPDLRWNGPDGREHHTGAVILVSNNPYRLRPVGTGTRPRMDTGELGVAVFDPERADREDGGGRSMRQWSTPTFEVRSGDGVPAGLDGEAITLEPPVQFASRPAALTVRIAPHHPGASPSAGLPTSARELLPRLVQAAFGRSS